MKFIAGVGVAALLLSAGCQNAKTKAVEGAVIGGVIGAAGGGIIGHQMGRGAEGAGIGAAVGVLSGALIGAQMEKGGQPAQTAQQAQVNNPNHMSLQQIVDLSKQGIHEDVIIDKIRLSNSRYALTNDDINYLQQQGVSQKVISVMQGA